MPENNLLIQLLLRALGGENKPVTLPNSTDNIPLPVDPGITPTKFPTDALQKAEMLNNPGRVFKGDILQEHKYGPASEGFVHPLSFGGTVDRAEQGRKTGGDYVVSQIYNTRGNKRLPNESGQVDPRIGEWFEMMLKYMKPEFFGPVERDIYLPIESSYDPALLDIPKKK